MASLQTYALLFKYRSILLKPSTLKAGSKLATPRNISLGTRIYIGTLLLAYCFVIQSNSTNFIIYISFYTLLPYNFYVNNFTA